MRSFIVAPFRRAAALHKCSIPSAGRVVAMRERPISGVFYIGPGERFDDEKLENRSV
jgi:hypothetical protein